MSLCFYSPLMRQGRGVSGCVHWCVPSWRVLNVCECFCCSHTRRHLSITACNNRILTVEIRLPAGSLVFMELSRTRPAHPPLSAALCQAQNLHVRLLPSRRGPGPQPLCGRRGQGFLVGGEVQTVGPADGAIWTSDPT